MGDSSVRRHGSLEDLTPLWVLLPPATELLGQPCVPTGAGGPAVGIALPRLQLVVPRWGDRQDGADRLDPECRPVRVDDPDHHLARRSSSAFAKNADASFR